MTQLFRRKAGSNPKEVWSSLVRWEVTMRIDNRGNVHHVWANCQYGQGDDPMTGHYQRDVGPFDDLDAILNEIMVESALRCSEQLTLFDRP